MNYISKKKYNQKMKRMIRMLFNVLCFGVAFATAGLMWRIYNVGVWNEETQVIKQIILVGGTFCLTYGFFAKMYQSQKIGVYRWGELAYFQLLAFGLTDVIMMFASMFWFRNILLRYVVVALIMLFIQLLVINVMIVIFNRIWMKYDQPQRIVIVYGDDGYLSVLKKMSMKPNVYSVQTCLSENEDYESIKNEIDSCDRLYLYKVNSIVRSKLILYCNEISKDIYLTREIEDIITMGFDISHALDTPFVRTSRNRVKWFYPVVKRLIDIALSGLALLFLSPIMLIVSILIKSYDGGPVFYSQTRLTKDHKEFKIHKFRSMIVDAEKNGARLATQNDNRITPVGKVIRATRIDELPQLLNIFLGDMTIVGPRPERPEIEKQYLKNLPEFGLRLQVKAGLTGYAQVYGKYNTTPEDKLKLDLLYINQRNLLLDLKLILSTIKIIFIPESTEGIEDGKLTAENK